MHEVDDPGIGGPRAGCDSPHDAGRFGTDHLDIEVLGAGGQDHHAIGIGTPRLFDGDRRNGRRGRHLKGVNAGSQGAGRADGDSPDENGQS